MRSLQTIILTVILICVAGCGKYILKSEVLKNYIPKEEVLKNYILKSEVQENYIQKSKVRTLYAANPGDHKCRVQINSQIYWDFCLEECPISPYVTDLGVPCP